MVFLLPEDVGLDTGCQPAPWNSLRDDVFGGETLGGAANEGIDEKVLVGGEGERDDVMLVSYVSDFECEGSPGWEVEFFAELVKGLAGVLDVGGIKDCEWGYAVLELEDLGEMAH